MNSHVLLRNMFQVKLMKVVWQARTQIAERSPQTHDITFENNLGCVIEEVDMIKNMFYLSYKRHVQCDYVYHALCGFEVVRHENVFNVKNWAWEFERFW
jgi:hypothetical protein